MKPILLNSHLLSLRPEKHQKVQRTKLKRHFTFLFVCHHLKCFLKTLKFCRDVFSSSSKAQMRLFFCFNCWWTERSTEACKIKPLGSCELCKDSTKRPEYHKAGIIKSSLMIPWIWFVCPVSHLKKKNTQIPWACEQGFCWGLGSFGPLPKPSKCESNYSSQNVMYCLKKKKD